MDNAIIPPIIAQITKTLSFDFKLDVYSKIYLKKLVKITSIEIIGLFICLQFLY